MSDFEPDTDAEAPTKGLSAIMIVLLVAGSLCGLCIPCGILATFLAPALLSAKARANEVRAKNSLRQIALGRAIYRDSLDGRDDEPTLAKLVERDLIDRGLADGEDHGYRFELKPGPTPKTWRAIAVSLAPHTKVEKLITDAEGRVRVVLRRDARTERTAPEESIPPR